MKAIIFNSGLGSRMKGLTEHNPKCMVKLYNGETIFERQIRILCDCGIKDIIVTTGPYPEQLYEVAKRFSNIHFEFVANEDYKNTNYIVSMHLANRYLDDDMLLLHGDLVFHPSVVIELLNHKSESVCLYDETKALPKKDFKGRFQNNRLLEVSVNIFEEDCYAFQPFYKLSKNDLQVWKDKVEEFVQKGEVKVYAENALNEILRDIKIQGMSYQNHYMEEIDDEEDYYRVLKEIQRFDEKEASCKELKGKKDFNMNQPYDKDSKERMEFDKDEQKIITVENGYEALKKLFQAEDKIFFVCSQRNHSLLEKECSEYPYDIFSEFTSNPKYEEIRKGVELFRKDSYSVIVSIGGGSAIDVAKCIKLFATVEKEEDIFKKRYGDSKVKHIAIPTTAGSGSESTQFAVMYYGGVKHSVDHKSILPEYVILAPSVLETLPDLQKKSTLLDAFCQAIESFWAKGATKKSREYAKTSIGLILNHHKDYLASKEESYEPILKASNYSGKAIHITRTTAAHAMSYKLTTDYQINHGHAVALCIVPIWKLLLEKTRENENLRAILEELAQLFGTKNILESIAMVEDMIEEMKLPKINIKEEEIEELVKFVDVSRMGNHPVEMTSDEIYGVYQAI